MKILVDSVVRRCYNLFSGGRKRWQHSLRIKKKNQAGGADSAFTNGVDGEIAQWKLRYSWRLGLSLRWVRNANA